MSLGFTRLNVKKAPPNTNIDFIKPLPGPNEAIAQDFLERIAAQCFPVMKKNYLFVRSLEEYEPNREFVGRNFNAGEVVQLVLRSPTSGRWLPFEYVQMVMMHELAHCKQMNHSRAFWAVRNQYAHQMEGLWAQGYTGEGIWGQGRELSSGAISRPTILAGEAVPEHLCGGTYRTNTSRRKRKAPALSRKEQQERRILKKFGANGVAIGADDLVKSELERSAGRRAATAKPRVAGSARGRDLRAAAALARLEQDRLAKQEESDKAIEVIELSDSDDDDDDGGYVDVDVPEVPDALDINGKRLTDKDGRGLVKVCDDEHDGDDDVKILASNEWAELLKRLQRPDPAAGQSTPRATPSSGLSISRPFASIKQESGTPKPARPLAAPRARGPSTAQPPQSRSSRRQTSRNPPVKKAVSARNLGFTRTLGSSSDAAAGGRPLGSAASRAAGQNRPKDAKQRSLTDMLRRGP